MKSEHESGTAGDEVWTLADDPEDDDIPMRWPEDPDAVGRTISD